MTIKYHTELCQGSGDWLQARCGLLTASEMKHILTPAKLQYASNDKERGHVYEILAQRISGYVEPSYISDDMVRGQEEEFYARQKYAEHYAPVKEVGFVTNSSLGFMIGYSPDGLIGEDGLIEIKSRRQKYQVEVIIDGIAPPEFMLQIQTGLWVTGRSWCDFISYSGGLPMAVIRVSPDKAIQDAIVEAAKTFEAKVTTRLAEYEKQSERYFMTERRIEQEIHV